MWRIAVALFVALLVWSTSTYADWVTFGAGARCIDGDTFTVLSTVELSSDDPAAVPLEQGFEQLGEDNRLLCRIGAARVEASISARGPRARGMCMGGGQVVIGSLLVNGIPIFGPTTPFNWPCLGAGRILTKIEIWEEENSPIVQVCDAKDWAWGKGYSDVQCQRISLIADNILNRTYKDLIAGSSTEERARLRLEQRAWLRARDDQCRNVAIRAEGHESSPLQFAQCVLSMTEQREKELKHWKP
jgi:uncharacterized protein YecT (DUF1311 family)